MKLINALQKLLMIALVMGWASCEESDVSSLPDGQEFENTLKSDHNVINEADIDEPLLQITFDATVGEEIVLAEFDKAIKKYKSENNSKYSRSSVTAPPNYEREFEYRTLIETDGAHTKAGSPGTVYLTVKFLTSHGTKTHFTKINQSGNYMEGGISILSYVTAKFTDPITWIAISGATLWHQGDNGWLPRSVSINRELTNNIQGNTYLYYFNGSNWLDAPDGCQYCWDTYEIVPNLIEPGPVFFD